MSRKPIPTKIGTEVKGVAPAVKASVTPVRNSAIPKVAGKKEVTHAMIAEKAYFIACSGKGGSETENWLRAERELKSA